MKSFVKVVLKLSLFCALFFAYIIANVSLLGPRGFYRAIVQAILMALVYFCFFRPLMSWRKRHIEKKKEGTSSLPASAD